MLTGSYLLTETIRTRSDFSPPTAKIEAESGEKRTVCNFPKSNISEWTKLNPS